jgi:hypothetical protein
MGIDELAEDAGVTLEIDATCQGWLTMPPPSDESLRRLAWLARLPSNALTRLESERSPPRWLVLCETNASPRDTHLIMIESLGRLGCWQHVSGYGKRALMETAMGRYKSIIGTRLRARDWRGQRTEAAIGVAVLNRMLASGRPNSVRTARSAA